VWDATAKRAKSEYGQVPHKQGQAKKTDGPVAKPDEELTTGEVRFNTAEAAMNAMAKSGVIFGGVPIIVEGDETSKDGTKVLVSGLPNATEWESLKQFFVDCGEVAHAHIKRIGSMPFVGQVRFETEAEAQIALSLSGCMLNGHELTIKVHASSKDGTKLTLFNLPGSLEWNDVKAFFTKMGITPAFANIASTADGYMVAEVRYEEKESAQVALETLNGSILGGAVLSLQADSESHDGTKLIVKGVPFGIGWQDLKDHFSAAGLVAFTEISEQVDGGKGKGKGQAGTSWAGGVAGWGGGSWTGARGGGKGLGGHGKAHCCLGEVRYDNPSHAQMAFDRLNGSTLKSATIIVGLDLESPDTSKLWVAGIMPGTSWMDLKDHFSQIGQVAFAQVEDTH